MSITAEMSGSRLRRTFSFLPAFHHLRLPTQIAVWLGSAQWIVRCDSVPSTLSRRITRMTVIGWTLGASNNPARRAGVTHSFLIFLQIVSQHLNSWIARFVGLVGLPFVRITATGGRLKSCRSCRGTQDLHVGPVPAFWPRTSTFRGFLFASRVRHQQLADGELLPCHPVPLRCSPQ